MIRLGFCTAVLLAAVAHAADPTPAFDWGRVAIGGGGWFTGILFHPRSTAQDTVLYARGDLAGILRWDAARRRWRNLCDSLPAGSLFLRGCDGMAVDPSDAGMDTVYAVLGEYEDHHNWWINDQHAALQGVWRSVDRGETWVQILKMRAGANQPSRWCGEPIAVDPRSGGKVVLLGTRKDGLWLSTNADATDPAAVAFRQISAKDGGPVPGGAPFVGIRCVVFDPRPGADNTVTIDGIARTKHVYVGVPQMGVWGSADGGVTWAKLAGGRAPRKEIRRMVVLGDGALVVAHEEGLSRYRDGAWTRIHPTGSENMGAVAVNPRNPDELVVFGGLSTAGRGYQSAIFRTTTARTVAQDAGWIAVNDRTTAITAETEAGWNAWTVVCNTSCAAINPAKPAEVWETDVYGSWMTPDITATPAVFRAEVRDLEIIVATTMDSPSAGPVKLWLGCGDVRGFRITDLERFPQRWIAEQDEGDCTYGLTAGWGQPRYVAKVSANSPWGGFTGPQYRFSTDGGETWTKGAMPDAPVRGPHLALSSDTAAPPRAVIQMQSGLFFTEDAFAAATVWQKAQGLPDDCGGWGENVLQADRKHPSTFYFVHTPDKGRLPVYVSTDHGRTWSVPGTQFTPPAGFDALPSGNRHPWRPNISTSPVAAGELWLAAGNEGLYVSQDGARHFRRIAAVKTATTVAAGLPWGGRTASAIYLLGEVVGADGAAVWGVHLSLDAGATWTRISTDRFRFPGGDRGVRIVGDGQVPGRVYIGDGNTGVIVGTLAGAR